ncbi:unnamed protein product [Gulo gulo]|uniref:Uncharacterized protein n=1 Tax=Gulo gulo TaxID=48420 RepID=A0A9X9LUE2_GULGU|nr:unnamed protein product [Gulo gulo]
MDTHTHTHTHAHTHTPHLTLRPSVEDTASVNPVKTSAQQASGGTSVSPRLDHLGFFAISPLHNPLFRS